MSDEKEYSSFAEEVWDVLSRIDVTGHTDSLDATDKRPAIDYLAWHKAWMLCKRNFPASTHEYESDLHHEDGTVEVGCYVYIRKENRRTPADNHPVIHTEYGGEVVSTYSRLAVMDNWMNPVANPSARQINDSRQRVLVKALAFAGLGLNLWGDDNMPVGVLADPITEKQVETLNELIGKTETNLEKFLEWCEVESIEELPTERYGSARGLLEAKLKRQERENRDAKAQD